MQIVQRWMQNNAYDIDPSVGYSPQLKWFDNPDKHVSWFLRPTIHRCLLEAKDSLYNKSKFLIEGEFGPDPVGQNYTVTWGGQPMQVAEWNEIEGVRVKLIPPYPSGSIRVKSGTRESDLVPITEWTLPMTYTMTGKGSLKYVVQFSLKIRVDARGFRYQPQDVPIKYPMVIWNLDDSGCTTSASGQYMPDPDTKVEWSGGLSGRSFDQGDPNQANVVSFSGQVNLAIGKIEKFFLTNSTTYTRTVNGGNATQMPASLDGYFGLKDQQLQTLNIPINTTTYVIPAGSAPAGAVHNSEGVSATLTWQQASPTNAPTVNTSR
jgi:hypothetical protein